VANIDDIKSKEIILEYPCEWEYKAVVEKNTNIDELLKPILKGRVYKQKLSKSSKEGTYSSYSIVVLVHNNEDRVCVYEQIRSHKNVKIVL
jgi:putative lipoic acid-binding regulatory protein